jgi:hypothetical protein
VHNWKENNLIIESNSTYVTIFDTDYIPNLLYDNDEFTTNGLIALRLGRFYEDQKFKDKVESQLSSFLKSLYIDDIKYFIPLDLYDKLKNCNKESLKLTLPHCGFHWKG